MSAGKSELIFIYGTLKRGFPNHAACMSEAEFVGLCETQESYPLVIGGRWHSPCLIDEPGSGLPVSGELYRVNPPTLAMLDQFESCDKPTGYLRKQIDIVMQGKDETIQVWTYLKPRNRIEGIHSDALSEYLDYGDYVIASSRHPPGQAGEKPANL